MAPILALLNNIFAVRVKKPGKLLLIILIEHQAMNDQTARLCIVIGVFVRAHDFIGIVVLRLMSNKIN